MVASYNLILEHSKESHKMKMVDIVFFLIVIFIGLNLYRGLEGGGNIYFASAAGLYVAANHLSQIIVKKFYW